MPITNMYGNVHSRFSIIAQYWKQSKCPSREGKMQYIHVVEYYTAMKSDGLTHTMTMTLTDITLNNRSQTQKETLCHLYMPIYEASSTDH